MIRRTPRSTRTDTLLPYTSSSDLRRRGLLAAIPERGGQQGAGGGAAEDAFLLQQLARGQEAFLVADRVGLLHPAEVGDRRQEVLADALDHPAGGLLAQRALVRSEEHTSELQSLMRISYAVFCLKKKNTHQYIYYVEHT